MTVTFIECITNLAHRFVLHCVKVLVTEKQIMGHRMEGFITKQEFNTNIWRCRNTEAGGQRDFSVPEEIITTFLTIYTVVVAIVSAMCNICSATHTHTH